MDERLDPPELAVGVDAVQRERGAPAAALAAGERKVLRDLAGGLRIALVDLRKRQPDDEIGNLAGGLVLDAAGLLVQIVLALVRGGGVPELLRIVGLELHRIDGHDLEPVLPVLQALQDRVRQQVLTLLPVVGVEHPRLIVGCRARLRSSRQQQRGTERQQGDVERLRH
jgi:hypothetical protein